MNNPTEHSFIDLPSGLATTSEGVIQDDKLRLAGFEVVFYSNGRLAQVKLKENTVYNGRIYLKDTYLTFYDSGDLYSGTFANEEWIGTQSGLLKFASNELIYFHPNGNVWQGHNVYVGGILYPYDFTIKNGTARFYPSGGLEYCNAERRNQVAIYGQKFGLDAGRKVSFYDFSKFGEVSIKKAYFTDNVKFSSFYAHQLYGVSFYEGQSIEKPGQINSFVTNGGSLIQGFQIPHESLTDLYSSGRLKMFTISAEISIGGHDLEIGEKVGLYESGLLKQWIPKRDVTIDGKNYPANTSIFFDIHGQVL